ncbi:MAG: sulfotransferase [Bauldia sp.]
MWCAKEVGGGNEDILSFWRYSFGESKALFLVRDPLFTTRAVLNDRRRKGVRLPVSDVIHQVTDPLRTMRRQMRYLDDPDVHFTVYEDLVADPEREMRKVTEFLGIAWSPTFTRPSLFGEPVVVRTASQQTTEVFRATTQSWRDGLTEREQKIVAIAARIARSLPHLAVDYEVLRERIARRHAELGPAARPAAVKGT